MIFQKADWDGGERASTPRSVMTMNAWERQQVFREMVVQQLHDGGLSHGRRKQIIQYAACLGIEPVLAGRLIGEAGKLYAERAAEADARNGLRLISDDSSREGFNWRPFIVLLVGAILLNSWLIISLFKK